MSNKYGFREDETMYKMYLVPFCHSLFNFLIVFVGSSNISEWFLPKQDPTSVKKKIYETKNL